MKAFTAETLFGEFRVNAESLKEAERFACDIYQQRKYSDNTYYQTEYIIKDEFGCKVAEFPRPEPKEETSIHFS
jgi:hypothetical protein